MAEDGLTSLRLLVVSQYFWPEEFRINDLVAELGARGHHISVLTGKPNYPEGRTFPGYERDPEKYSSYNGARVIRVPMTARGSGRARLMLNYVSYAAGAAVFGASRLKGKSFDAILVFEPSPVTVGLPAVALKKRYGWPIAFWVLDQWPDTLSAVGAVKSRFLLRSVGRLVKFIYSQCDLILAPTRSLAKRIAEISPRSRVEYFPNWTEDEFSESPASPAPEVPPAEAGVFTVMFAGNVGEAQDFPAILDAAERLKSEQGIRWVIIGDGRMADWVRSEVARRGLANSVVVLGRYPRERMPSFFAHADALLVSLKRHPIFAMTIPGKVQSYLGAGIPLIGMLDGDGAKVIQEAAAGSTCASGDSAGLAEIVRGMAAAPKDQRAKLGASGAAYARREFDRAILIDRLERWLGEIAAATASRPRA